MEVEYVSVPKSGKGSFFFKEEDGIRDIGVTGVQTCALPIYAEYLPLTDKTPRISLGEGNTPLVQSRHIGPALGLEALYFKLEMCNPTGSFKDRGMVMAVAKAVEEGAQALLCASTGNTSASAAAYAAHCGLQSYVFLPGGRVAPGKLAQTIA